MGQVFTEFAAGSAATIAPAASPGSVQLSDGTSVFLASDNGGTTHLQYQPTDLTAPVDIDANAFFGFNSQMGSMALCVDSSDNLYLVGVVNFSVDGGFPAAVAYVKGSGYTWTKKAQLTAPSSGLTLNPDGLIATWASNGTDAIVLIGQASGNSIRGCTLSAGNLRAGSGALLITAPTAIGSVTTAWAWGDIAANGFGASSGLFVYPDSRANTTLLGTWSINTSGQLTASVAANVGGISAGTPPGNGSATYRVLWLSSNLFAVVAPDWSTGHYRVTTWNNAGTAVHAVADSGAPTNLPLKANTVTWDAYQDPVVAGRLWVIAPGAQSGGNVPLYALSCDCSGGNITWATTTTLVDTLTGAYSGGSGVLLFRSVQQPRVGQVEWQALVQTTGTVRAVYGGVVIYQQAPLAPSNLTPPGNPTLDQTSAQTLGWQYNPTDGTACSRTDLQWRQGTGAWTTVTQNNGNTSMVIAANTFPSGSVEWQVRNYNGSGQASAWSASSFFTAGVPPAGPAVTAPASGGTVAANPTPVTWTVTNQTAFQVRRVADAGGSPDPTTVYYDSGSQPDPGNTTRTWSTPFETNNRWEHVQVRIQSGGLWSTWTDVRVDVSYTPAPQPTLTVTPDSTQGTITVQVTNPAPGAGQPAISYNDVYRRVGATGTPVRVATQLAPGGTWVDRTPGSGTDYQYQAVAWAVNATSIASPWTD